MLDVIGSRMQSGQVRTNPAALLRGVIRKYQTDPNSFDPSSGFHLSDQRRHRAATETRLRADAADREQQAKQREEKRTSERLSPIGRQCLNSMLQSLQGH